jgi:basic membrane lipoprotein Med (substrate-binding protein (PBP1-ABC) superfamily)
MVKRYDTAVYEVMEGHAAGDELPPNIHFGLVDGGVDISYSGDHLTEIRAEIERLRAAIVAGEIQVACRPADRLERAVSEPSTCVG